MSDYSEYCLKTLFMIYLWGMNEQGMNISFLVPSNYSMFSLLILFMHYNIVHKIDPYVHQHDDSLLWMTFFWQIGGGWRLLRQEWDNYCMKDIEHVFCVWIHAASTYNWIECLDNVLGVSNFYQFTFV